jgi:hypothetical protein
MELVWDPAKSAKNAEERGLPFDLTTELDWRAAQIIETRYVATQIATTSAGSSVGRLQILRFVRLRGRQFCARRWDSSDFVVSIGPRERFSGADRDFGLVRPSRLALSAKRRASYCR